MRVGHEAARIIPGEQNVTQQDGPKRSGERSLRAGREDTVQISSEARDLHAGRARHGDDARMDDVRFARIRQRIESGHYDSKEARLALAEELLSAFGI